MPQSLLMVAKAASTPIKRGIQVSDSQRIKPLSIGNFTYRQRPKVLIHNGLIPTTAAGRRRRAEKVEPTTAAGRRAEKLEPTTAAGRRAEKVEPTTAAGRRTEKLEPTTAAGRRAENHTPACYLGQAPLTDTATMAATTETATSAERTDASESSP